MKNKLKGIFNIKSILPVALAAAGILGSTGCRTDADVASRNLSLAAENFEINRRIVFYNGITGEYMLSINGRCSVESRTKQLAVTCKTGEKEFKKHYLGLSDNVTYFSEQLDGAEVSAYHYRVVFKPQTIVPDVDVRTNRRELQSPSRPK